MPTLLRHTGDNKAGICKIELAIACDVTGLPVYDGRGTINHNSFETFESQFYPTYHTPDTAQHLQTEKNSKNGTFFSQNLSFKVPKDRIDVLNVLRSYKNVKLIALATYKNGNQKLIGTKEYPLQLTVKFDSGKNHTDFNHFHFQLTGNTYYACPSLYYFLELPPLPANIITISDTNPSDTEAEEENPLNVSTYVISRVQGDLNTTTVNIAFSGVGITPSDATLQYQDTFGTWFEILNNLVSIQPNQNEVQIRLVATNDSEIEEIEYYSITISNATNQATIQNDTVTGRINELPINEALISLHLVGPHGGKDQLLTLSEKLTDLSIANPLNLCTYTMKYSDSHTIPDWTQINPKNLTEIQAAINQGTDNYLLYFEVQSYTSIMLNAVLGLKYLTFNPVASVQYISVNKFAQNIWIAIPQGMIIQLTSINSAKASPSLFRFGLKNNLSDDFTYYNLTLAGLNALLLSMPSNTDRIIIIYSEYTDSNTGDVLTLTFN